MYKKIMVPVDLEQQDKLQGALSVAGQMAEMCGAEIVYASVHGPGRTPHARTEAEHETVLKDFAKAQPAAQICKTSALPLYSHDPAVEIATSMVDAAAHHDVDLIVMNSHIPGWAEHVFHSNAGYVACHAPISVFVVR